MQYFELDQARTDNLIPHLARIMLRGSHADPTARDAVAAAVAINNIAQRMDTKLDERMRALEQRTTGALIAVLAKLEMPAAVYKRAGELLEQEIERRFFGTAAEDDEIDSWCIDEEDVLH